MYNRLFEKKRLILSLPLLLAAAIFTPASFVPYAHASPGTGLVCITASTSATSCSAGAPTLGPFNAGDTFSVGVFIQGSDAMGGFDIYVAGNPAYLNPTGAALGTLIASPTSTIICINGVSVVGACTVNSANGQGVVEVSTLDSNGSNECGGISPCSGMAFTITYQVVGATPSTSLSYPTHPACSTSSVSSPPNTCVLVSTAFGDTLSENIQGANVTITLPPAVVCILPNPASTSCPVGTPDINPITAGQSFTVGVFVQGSAPLGGFNIYVTVDRQYLNPTDAQLGSLIPSPTNTIRCINGISLEGQCDPPPPNGLGVVQVSTFDSSGTNVCSAAPCSGLAFTITYQKVGTTPTTGIDYPVAPLACATSSVSSPPNVCVQISTAQGDTLPENIQPAVVTEAAFVDNVTISKSCTPNPIEVYSTTTCTVTITDTIRNVPPVGKVIWTTDAQGVNQPQNYCTLQAVGPSQPASSQCSVVYLPIGVGTGIHNIGVIYNGDTVHSGGIDPFPLNVAKATVIISSQVIWDETGQAPPALGVRAGSNVHDTVVLTGGAPPQGVSGQVTYSVYSNGACTGTSVFTSTVNVRSANDVPTSASFTTPFKGLTAPVTYSFIAAYSGDGNNFAASSSCEQFIIAPYPSISSAHWTHHLSLVKHPNGQSWSIGVKNPLTSGVQVVIRIQGHSNINPSMTIDVICATTCADISQGFDNAAAAAGPITVAAGATVSFSFNQPISNAFANQKISFTATVYWTTGPGYLKGSGQQNGSFAVVP